MDFPRTRTAFIAAALFDLRTLIPARPHGIDVLRFRIGPTKVAGNSVLLRGARLADAAQWREIRMQNQRFIEPIWLTSPLSWSDRHTETMWVRECLQKRRLARRGFALPLVVEVDGCFAGECSLEWINPYTRTAELGGWLDSRHTGKGIGVIATAMLLDYAFTALRICRVSAPITPDNIPVLRGAVRIGFNREGTMASFLDVGGSRRTHELWALTTADLPQEGLVALILDQLQSQSVARVRSVVDASSVGGAAFDVDVETPPASGSTS